MKDINGTAASQGSHPDGFTPFNGALYFAADDGVHGKELWKTDGTASGTVLVKDINPASGSFPHGFFALDSALYFFANDGVGGTGLWKTDGTAAGTVRVKGFSP
jgi:ELWxxDGT repeat protein